MANHSHSSIIAHAVLAVVMAAKALPAMSLRDAEATLDFLRSVLEQVDVGDANAVEYGAGRLRDSARDLRAPDW